MIVAFAAAVQFLLLSPAFIRRPFTAREMGSATAFFPLVGLLLGGVLALTDFLLAQFLPAQVRSALILALWVILTGALHFDGFLDTCDGLLGGDTPQRRLDIMRDERTGAYGVAGGALLLILMYAALSASGTARWAALLLAPSIGRCALTLSVVTFPYARQSGLGRDIKEHAHAGHAAAALITTIVAAGLVTWQLRSLVPAAAILSAAIVWWFGSRFVLKRIAGMTGDTYGALNMLCEAVVLLAFAAAS